MKKALAALLLTLCLNHYTTAQNTDASAQPSSNSNKMRSAATTQPAELVEAKHLSADVVKLFAEKKYDEALPLAQHALELREKMLGQEHELVGAALSNLASIYLAKKNYGEAESLFHRSLAIYEKRYGKDDLTLCPVLDNYAAALLFKGKFTEADAQLERALKIRLTILGDKSLEVARSIYMMGDFHRLTGKYGEAALNYRSVVNNRKLDSELKSSADADDDYFNSTSPVLPCLDMMKLQQKEAMDALSRGDILQPKQNNSDKSDAKNTADPGAKVVKSGVLNGKAISKAFPEYPLEAKRAGVSGTIPVMIKVDETGKVVQARAFCGDPSLARASVSAARRSRFSPTLLSGVPVKVTGIITYNFTLQYDR